MNRCETCSSWDRANIDEDGDATCRLLSADAGSLPDPNTATMLPYGAWLTTSPNFGCTEHTPAVHPPDEPEAKES